MMKDKAMNDLAYIRELMLDTRKAASLSGGYFILWGLLVALALIATWLQVVGVLPYKPLLTWTICFVLGISGNFYLVRRDRRAPVQMPAGRLIGMIWVAMGVTTLIIFYAGFGTGGIPGEHLSAIFASLIGSGVFLTGVLAGLNWVRNLAFGWWAGSLVMFTWPGNYTILFMGLMLLVLYVVPGVILSRMKQPQSRASGA